MKRFAPLSCLAMVISLFLVFAIWLAPAEANTAPVFASLGQLRATWNVTPGVNQQSDAMAVPGAMDLDAAGNLYVADAGSRKVYCFDTYGNLKRIYSDAAFRFADNRGLTSGRGLAVTPDGSRLYVARDKAVLILDVASGAVAGELRGSVAAGTMEFGLVGEIDLDADGNVFVADAGSGRMLIKIYSAAGQFRSAFGGVGTALGKFESISALTVTAAGQVVVADPSPANTTTPAAGGKVQVFTIDPVTLAVTNTVMLNKAVGFGTPELHTPRGIAFDQLGRGYFLEYFFSAIRVLNAANTYLSTFSNPGSNAGQLANLADTVYDAVNNRLFVSCDGGRIEIFGIDGGSNPVHANTPPTVPVAQSPVGGSVVETAAPVLVYVAASDDNDATLTYQVVVKQGETTTYSTTTAATAVTVPAGVLAENGAFTWAVQAVDSEDEASGFCSPAAFVVNAVDEAPSIPELQEPLAGATLAGSGVLRWSTATDPDPNDAVSAYRVDVAADDAFGAVIMTAQLDGNAIALADFATYGELVLGGHYFCRVTALDRDGTPSLPSAPVEFIYDTTRLTVNAPLQGATVYLGGNLAYPGRRVGTTPLEVRDLAPGSYTVAVAISGFELYLTQVQVNALGRAAVNAALKPAQQPLDFVTARTIGGRVPGQVAQMAAPFMVDFDNNRQLDLLVGDASGQLTLFRDMQVSSNGSVSFVGKSTLSLPVIPGAVPFVIDWNNDDRKDLLVGAADGTVKLLLNVGQDAAPQFAVPQDLQANGNPLSVGSGAAPVVVDLDQDGRKDLVVGNALGQVSVCWNQAQGTDGSPQLAAPALLFSGAAVPVVPAVIDWDSDGYHDLLVASASGVTVYRNDLAASGGFVAAPLRNTPVKAVFPVDVDGSKGEDLLIGLADGKLQVSLASSALYPPTYPAALLGKLDELAALLTGESPVVLAYVEVIRGQINEGSYAGAAVQAQRLADRLAEGPALQATRELIALCATGK